MIYLDTGCLVKLYYPEPESAAVVRRVAGRPVIYTPLHELELANALNQKRFHQQATERQVTAALALIQADLAFRRAGGTGLGLADAFPIGGAAFDVPHADDWLSFTRYSSLLNRRRSSGGGVHHHGWQTKPSGAGDGADMVGVVTRRITPSSSPLSTPAAHQTRR